MFERRAWVLMTAMPPTKGHLRLIQFAAALAPTQVIVCTQPDEPYPAQRYLAVNEAAYKIAQNVHWYSKTIEQDPTAPGFWQMWKDIFKTYGFKPGDYIVASETYGKRLAEEVGGVFMPYDIGRTILYTKGTEVRNDPFARFDEMLPEFQRYLRKTVTVFGAESTGKTTLSKDLAYAVDGHWLFEWARPYLETCGIEITTESMTAIWTGQMALQHHAESFADKPFIIQDTDLFSTVGYWDFWDMNTPLDLVKDAHSFKSDLYLITQSNIPFEQDPIRYGGDKRESDDQYWIDLCERHHLNYVVLTEKTRAGRLDEARKVVLEFFNKEAGLAYERQANA